MLFPFGLKLTTSKAEDFLVFQILGYVEPGTKDDHVELSLSLGTSLFVSRDHTVLGVRSEILSKNRAIRFGERRVEVVKPQRSFTVILLKSISTSKKDGRRRRRTLGIRPQFFSQFWINDLRFHKLNRSPVHAIVPRAIVRR